MVHAVQTNREVDGRPTLVQSRGPEHGAPSDPSSPGHGDLPEIGVGGLESAAVVDGHGAAARHGPREGDPTEACGGDGRTLGSGEIHTPMAAVRPSRGKAADNRTGNWGAESGARSAEPRCGERDEGQDGDGRHILPLLPPPGSTVHTECDKRKGPEWAIAPRRGTYVTVRYTVTDRIAIVTIDRPRSRNAVDRATADGLLDAWRRFDRDDDADVGILTGAGGTFCSGADLARFDLVDRPEGHLGMSKLRVAKPTIAAIEGYAVAGGLELALWCDLRVMADDAILGCFERRWGVPLIDGGTQRLPHIVGLGRAMDLILTGRPVAADEALAIGLANYVAPSGEAIAAARRVAATIAAFPQPTVRSDRAAMLDGLGRPLDEGLAAERRLGLAVLETAAAGAARFAAGAASPTTAAAENRAGRPTGGRSARRREPNRPGGRRAQRHPLDEHLELAKRPHLVDCVAQRPVRRHDGVARVPVTAGLWVQPVQRPRLLGDRVQHFDAGLAVVVAGVTRHDHRGSRRDGIHELVCERRQRRAVVAVPVAAHQPGVGGHLRHGVVKVGARSEEP